MLLARGGVGCQLIEELMGRPRALLDLQSLVLKRVEARELLHKASLRRARASDPAGGCCGTLATAPLIMHCGTTT